jgi:hypothetical protein
MRRLTKFLEIIAIGAVIMAFAGCDPDPKPGPNDEMPGIDLPAINEGTTGQSGITGTDISLQAGHNLTQALVNGLDLAGETNQNGVTWSVTGGKLSFSLGTPGQTATLDAEMIGDWGDWTNVQISPADAQAYLVSDFESYTEETSGDRWERVYYRVAREKSETDEETYYRDSNIAYLYVSKDVVVSGQSGQYSEDDYTVT